MANEPSLAFYRIAEHVRKVIVLNFKDSINIFLSCQDEFMLYRSSDEHIANRNAFLFRLSHLPLNRELR